MATEAQIAGLAKAREKRKANAEARKLVEAAPKTDDSGLLVEGNLGIAGMVVDTTRVLTPMKVEQRKYDLYQMSAWQEFFASAIVSCGVTHETQLTKAISLADAMLAAYVKKREEVK